ncbi:MAG: hypothetical protein GY771_13215 [bacterium]|nr:hypothetical protein [bacterium]
MKGTVIIVALLCALPVAASEADTFILSENRGSSPSGTTGTQQDTIMLSWDNGEMAYSICWYSGNGHWVGNDFGVAGYSDVNSMLIRTRDDWPNQGFDGFYIAIYDDSNDKPSGVIIWPIDGNAKYIDKYELQANFDEGWVDLDVDYGLSDDKIYACMEQRNNYPDADPFCVDTNTTDRLHSWQNNGLEWRRLDTGDLGDINNNNLMLRLRVTPNKGITTTSLGVVKALYR